MALQKTITENVRLVGDIDVCAYIKVASVHGRKEKVSAEVVYTKDDKHGEFIKAICFEFKPDLEGGNFIEQAYKHLKTLPEFDGAVDC